MTSTLLQFKKLLYAALALVIALYGVEHIAREQATVSTQKVEDVSINTKTEG
jgi:hypothetical protein